MDTDESDQIISEKPNIKRKKRKKNLKNLLQVEIIGNNKIPRLVLILVILIIIILIINISQLLLLYRDMDKYERRNETEILNEDNNINIFKEEKNPENQNTNQINELKGDTPKNTSINITEEIDNFVKSRRKISEK